MANALRAWSAQPHGAIERLTPSIATVTGDLSMPLTSLERRMTVVRLSNGGLVIYSAIALTESAMQQLESLGRPRYLVVPSHLHRRDAFIWKERYPELVVVAPRGARAEVEEVVAVDTCEADFGDDAVQFIEVPGTAGKEAALAVREDGRITLVLNDIVGNLPSQSGLVLRMLGFATERPRVPRMVRAVLVKDATALRSWFDACARQPVERIVVSHGRPIQSGAQRVLRELASSL